MSMNTRFFTVLKGCFIHGKHTTEKYPTEFPYSSLFANYFKDSFTFFLNTASALHHRACKKVILFAFISHFAFYLRKNAQISVFLVVSLQDAARLSVQIPFIPTTST